MAHEIKYRNIEIPALDAFLIDYDALCKKHGVKFKVDEYGYDGGHYVTVEAYDGGASFYLNLDYADPSIPFIAQAIEDAEAIRRRDEIARNAKEAIEQEARDREAYARLKAKYEPR
jgi:hypothetical protein